MSLIDSKMSNAVGFFEELKKYSVYDIKWELSRYEEFRLGLLARSPFQVGDIVKLNRTPNINEETAPGWMSSKHFLIKGAKAEVKDVDFYKGSFVYGLCFEDDSYFVEYDIDNGYKKLDKPKLVPTETKGQFMFAEKDLTMVKMGNCSRQDRVCSCGLSSRLEAITKQVLGWDTNE